MIKAVNALVMALVVFPAYGLARLVVSPRWALFAAAGNGARAGAGLRAHPGQGADRLPGLGAGDLPDHALGRPAGTVGTRARRCGSILGVLAKEQLQVLFPILAIGVLAVVWRRERLVAFRRDVVERDWIGAVALVAGGAGRRQRIRLPPID